MPTPADPLTLLRSLESPADLRARPESELADICAQLREYLIRTVATRGGHFAAGLGTVELTVALHYVFDTPGDRLVWDVGHQAYPHKVLTGRRDRLDTIKQGGGLAPFPARSESEYDTFGVGHSSTSISAALGMAVAAELRSDPRKVVAIIGDGAITAGMAWEALLNAGARKTNLLVILNDNDMSISENVGALSNYFAKVLSGRMYSTLRSGGKKILKQMPTMWELARRSEEFMKGMVLPGTIFEELGFNYIGPMNGHDIKELVTTLRNMRNLKGPQLLHVVTRKGKGYEPAERTPSSGTVRVRSTRPAAPSSRRRPRVPATRRCSANGCATSRNAIHASWRSHRPCAKDPAWSTTPASSRSGISTSPSPSSTPSRSRRDWPAKGCGPWWLSTRPSCSAPTTS
jgi:1-deoxy-D-xylulose-5-phosphate synthase